MVYFQLDQFGETQAEYRAALVASTIANTARDEKKQKQPFQPQDFMRPGYKDEPLPEAPEPEDLMKKIDRAMEIMGGNRGSPF